MNKNAMTANPTFRFSVDDNGKFSYDPKGEWEYVHRYPVRFVSSTGPFTISVARTDVNAGSQDLQNPFGGNLQGQPAAGGTWAAEAKVQDGLTEAVRRTEWLAKGFIAKYKYR